MQPHSLYGVCPSVERGLVCSLFLVFFFLTCGTPLLDRTGGSCGWMMPSGGYYSQWYFLSSWFCGGHLPTTKGLLSLTSFLLFFFLVPFEQCLFIQRAFLEFLVYNQLLYLSPGFLSNMCRDWWKNMLNVIPSWSQKWKLQLKRMHGFSLMA